MCSVACFGPMEASTSSPQSFSRPWSRTFAPSAAHRMAMALPMPVVLPVTMMTLPVNRILYGFKNAFDYFSAVHFFKGFFPFGDGPDPSDDGSDVQLTACQEG